MPTVKDRFSVEARLGKGAFGVVYRALDRKLGTRVALKTLSNSDPTRLYRLKSEFRSLAGIVHPNLATLYELVAEGDQWLLSMELIDGRSFVEYVRGAAYIESSEHVPTVTIEEPTPEATAGRPSFQPAVGVLHDDRLRGGLAQLAAGLSALHEAGKLHRDVKPSNVLVEAGGRVVLLDFGMVTDTERSAESEPGGTPAYMAPEHMAGQACEASDWYSVGAMLHECLTGWPPRSLPNALGEEDSHIPADLRDLCLGLLQRDPAERFGRDHILRVCAGEPADRARIRAEIVGRAAETEAMRRALESTVSGRIAVVSLAGLSGIGKSALLAHFRRQMRSAKPAPLVFEARCFEREEVRYKALDGVVDGIAGFLDRIGETVAASYLPRDVAALARVFPVLTRCQAVKSAHRRTVESGDLQNVRRRAFGALRELLSRIAAVQPTAVLIDDLQWSDLDSVPLLETLLREPEAPAMLLVAAYRSEESENPVMRKLLPVLRGAGVQEIVVGELAREDALRLAAGLSSDSRVEAAVREAGGNPFLIDAFLRNASDGPEEQGLALEEVIGRQIRELPEGGREWMELLAVAGGPAPIDMLPRAPDPKLLSILLAERLARTRGGADLECYHDRIREAVSTRIPPERARARHLWLAAAYAARPAAEPERVAFHFHEAGDHRQACPWAKNAAERAMESLGFNRAASFYAIALENPDLTAVERRALLGRLGDALTDAARAWEAAAAYREAAVGAPAAERIDLLRQAGERLMISGHFDDGYNTLRSVLDTVGIRWPATPRSALCSIVWRRVWLRIRGSRLRAARAPVTDAEKQHLEALGSMVGGLAVCDPIRAMDFQSRLMLATLHAGDPQIAARVLAMEVCILGAGGGRTWGQTKRTMARAETLVASTGDDGARFLLTAGKGLALFYLGQFPEAIAGLEEALNLPSPLKIGPGVLGLLSPVRPGAVLAKMFAHAYTGDLDQIRHELPERIADSRSRGDLHTETSLRCRCAYITLLADDRPELVEPEVRGSAARWTQTGYHFQHFWALMSLIETDLYLGHQAAALARLDAEWVSLTSSMLFRTEFISVEAHCLRGRVDLAVGRDRVRHAVEQARVLEGTNRPWAQGLALLLRAGAAQLRGEGGAVDLLKRAADIFHRQVMRFHEAAARRRISELTGDAAGAAAAALALSSAGVSVPERFFALLTPGFDDPRP